MDRDAQLIDWDVATAAGVRLARPGPAVTPAEARRVVADLRAHAGEARAIVADYTKLVAPSAGAVVAVIDRPGWIRANVAGFAQMLQPVVEKVSSRRGDEAPGGLMQSVGSRATGVEAGALLAFLSSKVLGQYEMFPPLPPQSEKSSEPAVPGPGRLLLVAPNVVAAERQMGVDARDFRMWVCLHEETHRVQFGAVPWLRDHVLGELREYLDETELEPTEMLKRIGSAATSAVRKQGDASLMELFQTPRQREILARITAVMSLLEGHADFVMDGVGPEVVPSVEHIRQRFTERRAGAGWLDVFLRRLLGVEAKMRQYRDGAKFVRGVVERVGMEKFNRVWDSPESLPTPEEILAPETWVARMHGDLVPA